MYKRVAIARLLKWLVSFAVVGVLVFTGHRYFSEFGSIFPIFSSNMVWVLLAVLLLMPLNLAFETLKFSALFPMQQRPRFAVAFKSVVAGVSTALITPNRIGEFVGRIAVLPPSFRKSGALFSLAGSGIQGLVTAVFGMIGMALFRPFPTLPFGRNFEAFGWYIAFAAVLLSLVFWFRKPLKRPVFEAYFRLRNMPSHQMWIAFLFGGLRYIVFSTQFAIALYAFGFSGDILTAYTGIFLVYFCQSFLPLTTAGELGVRELLAVLFFGRYFMDPFLAVFPALVIWVTNIALVTLVGLVCLKSGNRNYALANTI